LARIWRWVPPSQRPPFSPPNDDERAGRRECPPQVAEAAVAAGVDDDVETRREEQLARFGLTLGDFDMLATMRRRAAEQLINIRELQRSLMLSSGGTTKRLDRLEVAGLIERLPATTDRRGVLIGLSPAGRTVIDGAVPAITSYETTTVQAGIDSTAVRAAVEDGPQRERERMTGIEPAFSAWEASDRTSAAVL